MSAWNIVETGRSFQDGIWLLCIKDSGDPENPTPPTAESIKALKAYGVVTVMLTKDSYEAGQGPMSKVYPIHQEFNTMNPWAPIFISGEKYKYLSVGYGGTGEEAKEPYIPEG